MPSNRILPQQRMPELQRCWLLIRLLQGQDDGLKRSPISRLTSRNGPALSFNDFTSEPGEKGLAVEPYTRPTKTVRAGVIRCFAWTTRFSGGRDHGRDRPNRGQSANGGRLRPTICVRVCSNIRELREVRGGRARLVCSASRDRGRRDEVGGQP